MYPSVALNLLYHRENQGETERSLRPLPESLLRDFDLSRGQLLKSRKAARHRPTIARHLVKMILLLAALGVCAFTAASIAASDYETVTLPDIQTSVRSIRVDVVEVPFKFTLDEVPASEDGLPPQGSDLVTQGYIYPEGFLDHYDGIDASGNPTRPDLVIGEWASKSVFVGDGDHAAIGPVVVSTQIFDFYNEPGWEPGVDKKSGVRNLVTHGHEPNEVGAEAKRSVTGGTGRYARAQGEALQEFLGFDDPQRMNVKQRHYLEVRR